MGRSPSRYGLAITRLHDSPTECWFEAMDGRHFHGHACFSQDNTLLYTTENDYASGAGKLGVRLVAENFRQIDEMDLDGIGPHDLLLMPDGKHVVVAIGGIQTHPDQPDTVLNLETMVSGLHYVNLAKGTISSRHDCPYPQLSVRHLALDKRGKVWFGCQYEGLATDRVPLAGTHAPGQPDLRFIQVEQDTWQSHRQYVGSIAYCVHTDTVAMTSPKGSCISFWQSHPPAFLGLTAADDICAIAALSPDGSWIAGTGKGRLLKITQREAITIDTAPIQWDNHAVTSSLAAFSTRLTACHDDHQQSDKSRLDCRKHGRSRGRV
jgi:hypothetical protein